MAFSLCDTSLPYAPQKVKFHLRVFELAVLWPNGSGKATLLKVIFGNVSDYIVESVSIVYPSYSKKSIFDFNEKELLGYHANVGYRPQKEEYTGLNKINIKDLILDDISDTSMSREEAFALFKKPWFLF